MLGKSPIKGCLMYLALKLLVTDLFILFSYSLPHYTESCFLKQRESLLGSQ